MYVMRVKVQYFRFSSCWMRVPSSPPLPMTAFICGTSVRRSLKLSTVSSFKEKGECFLLIIYASLCTYVCIFVWDFRCHCLQTPSSHILLFFLIMNCIPSWIHSSNYALAEDRYSFIILGRSKMHFYENLSIFCIIKNISVNSTIPWCYILHLF